MTLQHRRSHAGASEITASLRETALELIGTEPVMPCDLFVLVRREFGPVRGVPLDERRLWRVLQRLSRIEAVRRVPEGYVRTMRGNRLLADLTYLHDVEAGWDAEDVACEIAAAGGAA